MELTWITFPAIVLTVSLLAYVAAYTFKGTDLRINKVDVVDLDQQPIAGYGLPMRGSTWATLFSPQNRDYDVHAGGPVPGPPPRPTRRPARPRPACPAPRRC